MNRTLLLAALSLLALATPLSAQTATPAPTPAPAPGEIVAAAPATDWIAIAPADLLVMDLAPDARGRARRVIIQLMPAPFSQGWVSNIRTLAAAHWWDGTSINRVQDNYVVQWGDATEVKALPEGLRVVPEAEYTTGDVFTREIASANRIAWQTMAFHFMQNAMSAANAEIELSPEFEADSESGNFENVPDPTIPFLGDRYAAMTSHILGWPVGNNNIVEDQRFWPVHCYGMVGVGRNLSPDTGTGAELYTVIGHAPRHLDRNIALVGRVIEGIEHLSSLPRGTEALGFYATAEERTAITSVRIATDLPAAEQPRFHYLSTESETFARYADARANRRDPFFNVPAGGADICNIPVPVRRVP